MQTKSNSYRTGASLLALSVALTAAPAWAGTIEDFTGVVGDGFVLLDSDENVIAPGIAIYTDDPDNDDYIDNGFSPANVQNCVRSNQVPLTNPDAAGCDQGPGAGNRYKLRLTPGLTPMDLSFGVAPSATPGAVTEYFNFGKVTNQTGARVVSYQLQLGTGTGDNFVLMDPTDPSTAVLFDQLVPLSGRAESWPLNDDSGLGEDPLQRIWFPDGLFGNGGQEGVVGFFTDESAGFIVSQYLNDTATPSGVGEGGNILNAVTLTNVPAQFGDAVLATNMLPDGVFWDFNDDPSDESALLAWFDYSANGGNGAWIWGNLAQLDQPDGYTMQELADSLGVTVNDLIEGGVADPNDPTALAGAIVPEDIVAAIQSNPLFAESLIEDLANMNMNFNVDVGDIVVGEFTLRLIPTFADIVMMAGNSLQFAVAGALDAANVPFLNADPGYLALITEIEGLSPAEQQLALQTIGHDFLGSFAGLSYGMSSGALMALGTGGADADMDVSSRGTGRWAMGTGVTGFVEITGSTADQDATLGAAAYDTSTLGVHGGVEYGLNSEWSVGVMLSGVNGDADIAGNRGSVDADGYGITGFARYNGDVGGGALNVRMAFGMQSLSYDITRNIFIGSRTETATGSTDGDTIYAGVAADWMTGAGPIQYGPMASLEYYDMSIDGYTETGAGLLNLAVQGFDTDVFLGRIGVQGEYSSTTASGDLLELGGHLAYASRSGGDGSTLASFAGTNLPGFSAPLGSMDNEWLDLGAEVAMTLGGGGSRIGMEYFGAVSGDGYEGHSVGVFFEMLF